MRNCRCGGEPEEECEWSNWARDYIYRVYCSECGSSTDWSPQQEIAEAAWDLEIAEEGRHDD